MQLSVNKLDDLKVEELKDQKLKPQLHTNNVTRNKTAEVIEIFDSTSVDNLQEVFNRNKKLQHLKVKTQLQTEQDQPQQQEEKQRKTKEELAKLRKDMMKRKHIPKNNGSS